MSTLLDKDNTFALIIFLDTFKKVQIFYHTPEIIVCVCDVCVYVCVLVSRDDRRLGFV